MRKEQTSRLRDDNLRSNPKYRAKPKTTVADSKRDYFRCLTSTHSLHQNSQPALTTTNMRLTVLHISATLKDTWEKPPPNLTAIELPSISIFSSTVLLIPHYPIQQKHREEQEIGPRQQVSEPTCSGNRECLHQVAEVIRVAREAPPAYNVWNMTVNIYSQNLISGKAGRSTGDDRGLPEQSRSDSCVFWSLVLYLQRIYFAWVPQIKQTPFVERPISFW